MTQQKKSVTDVAIVTGARDDDHEVWHPTETIEHNTYMKDLWSPVMRRKLTSEGTLGEADMERCFTLLLSPPPGFRKRNCLEAKLDKSEAELQSDKTSLDFMCSTKVSSTRPKTKHGNMPFYRTFSLTFLRPSYSHRLGLVSHNMHTGRTSVIFTYRAFC